MFSFLLLRRHTFSAWFTFVSDGHIFLLVQKDMRGMLRIPQKEHAKGGMSFVSKDIPSEFAKQTRIRFYENLVTSLRLRKLAR